MTSTPTRIRRAALTDTPNQVLDGRGAPKFGVYAGIPTEIDLGDLAAPFSRGPVGRYLRHKKWMYIFTATDEVIITGAVVDAGPTGTGFLMVTDRATGEVLADASRPGAMRPFVRLGQRPTEGHRAHYLMPATLMTMKGDDRELRFQATLHRLPYLPIATDPWLHLDLRIEHGHHRGITAVSEIAEGHRLVSTTAKNAALPTRGELTIRDNGRTSAFSLASGLGGFDYTSGYLPRHTSWRWAYVMGRTTSGRSLGLNLVSDFTGIGPRAQENVVWVDGTPQRLDPDAQIRCDVEDPLKPWSVTTSDGSVDLSFTPMGVHREALNLGAVRSHFLQPTGHFSGRVRVDGDTFTLKSLPGVAEDQDVLW